ncbi:T3SS effector HopA1 family protein [Streptomyces pathocidini]|uniref:T3SS effector HopA1 family protein n=1 Tax=Streptomyces pathocidini TaxID=1650571 RepID=UPI0033EB19BF
MTGTAVLSTRLDRALDAVRVDVRARRARVGTREVNAESLEDLKRRLATALYEVLHAGGPEATGPDSQALRDPGLERRFRAAMPHHSTRSRATVLAAVDSGSSTCVVGLDGVRVRVPLARLPDPLPPPGTPVTVRHDAARPALSPGFFLVHGSAGRVGSGPILRVYTHLTCPDAAEDAWAALLRHLEEQTVPYQAKILSCPRQYPRRDAAVVYLSPRFRHVATDLVRVLAGTKGLGESTSCFTEELSPGIATAHEPDDSRPGAAGLSFGQHRTAAVAEGLIAHAESPGTPRAAAVAASLVAAGIDPADPSRNLRSPAHEPRRR